MTDTVVLLQAIVLGVVEGLTEFIPVSSTGHLILANRVVGMREPLASVFEVVIQLGAILAICLLYFARLWRVAVRLPGDPAARGFVVALAVAFLPSAVLGLLLHDFIKTVLFSDWVVVTSMILGGVAILAVERLAIAPRHAEAERIPIPTALAIGLCQVVSMIPGVSRSGATILGAVAFGVERRAAAEFSFFLAIPTMLGATALDLYKARDLLSSDDLAVIAVGFLVSLVVAVIVVRAFLAFLVGHDFRVFAWYRIIAGLVIGAFLVVYGPAPEGERPCPEPCSMPQPSSSPPASSG